MVKHMPIQGWEPVARSLCAVEDDAEWPLQMQWVRFAVLGKPGTEGPPEATKVSKVRLIAVENLLVRAWATARAMALMPWLKHIRGDRVIGGVQGRVAVNVGATRDCIRTFCRTTGVALGEVSLTSPDAWTPFRLPASLPLRVPRACRYQ